MPTREARLATVARRHLPPAVAERWTSLIRPGVRLRVRDGGRQVGHLGGEPLLPADVAWPEWEGEGSLNFVASIDCGRLPANSVDIALPDSGTLLFFYYDPESAYLDNTPHRPPTVGAWDPETQAGARVLYVPADAEVVEHDTPLDIEPYDYAPLVATVEATGPDWYHPEFRALCRDLSEDDLDFLDDHRNGNDFARALRSLRSHPSHQVGGHALPIQNPAETDVAQSELGPGVAWESVVEEARRWTLLAQIDSDQEADLRWGDVGTLYWLIRPEDLAARDFGAARFTWQCG
ncbi:MULTISPECIES: YwqG family protein [unclassified Saccharothrix]|uniref:YwqG family protein n=1 Tax=unclassified Saccharothrix TaxID=2593673 RepID=UPI00307F6FFB